MEIFLERMPISFFTSFHHPSWPRQAQPITGKSSASSKLVRAALYERVERCQPAPCRPVPQTLNAGVLLLALQDELGLLDVGSAS